MPEFREAAAGDVRAEFGIPVDGRERRGRPGAKVFEQFFCEAFLDPGDGVLVFSPHFPTYVPNIERRGARAVLSPLRQANGFRPDLADVERFLDDDPKPRAIFLNSPHNPTGGVATTRRPEGASPTSSAAATSPCSATSRTATWSGAAGITRSWPAGHARRSASRPTRSASRTA